MLAGWFDVSCNFCCLFRKLTDEIVKTDTSGANLYVFFAHNQHPDVVGTTWVDAVCHDDGVYSGIIVEYMKNDLLTAEVNTFLPKYLPKYLLIYLFSNIFQIYLHTFKIHT